LARPAGRNETLMTRIATLILMTALALAAVGCSSSSNSSSGPNVDGSKQVLTVTASEKASVCDWFAGLVGGYGTTTTCSMAVITAPPTQAECVTDFPACAVTVSTFETCVNELIAAQETCTMQSLNSAELSAACQMVGQAGCFN
jgi:hypothetical protein